MYIVDLESMKMKYILYDVNMLVRLGKGSSINWYPPESKAEDLFNHLPG